MTMGQEAKLLTQAAMMAVVVALEMAVLMLLWLWLLLVWHGVGRRPSSEGQTEKGQGQGQGQAPPTSAPSHCCVVLHGPGRLVCTGEIGRGEGGGDDWSFLFFV